MLSYTLLADGSSDECLIPIIDWAIAKNFPERPFTGTFATDLPPMRHGLAARVQAAVRMFPCNILFVHRDCENQPAQNRYTEIAEAAQAIGVRVVAVVPIRMMEAWLLISAEAIRMAAGNPTGQFPLDLPPIGHIEASPNPKQTLLKALADSTNLGPRRRATFNAHARRRRVAECIDDFTVLRQLHGFARFETDLQQVIPQI